MIQAVAFTSAIAQQSMQSAGIAKALMSVRPGACPGGGSVGSGPTTAPAHGRFYTYVLNNIDVVITIIYSQKYVLFEMMYFLHRFFEM